MSASTDAAGVVEGRTARTRAAPAVLVPGVLFILTLGTLVCDALTPRDLSMGEDAPIWNTSRNLLAFDLSRGLTAVVLFASAATITLCVIRRGFPRAGLSTWLSYLAFVLSDFVLPGVTGHVAGFDSRLLYPPLMFSAIYFARPMPSAQLVALCKVVLLAFVYCSLAAAAIIPSHAVAGQYAGLFSGLDFRLEGVGGGSTSLGTLSAAYLTIEVGSPSRSRTRFLHIAAATSALVLTQGKTAWLFVLAVLLYYAIRRLRRWLAPAAFGAGTSAKVAVLLALSCGVAAVVGLSALYLARLDLESVPAGDNLVTLTGRTYVWATSLRVWLDSPVFGYGLGLWEIDFRARYGNFDHAHNQFIHSLASAGLVGLFGLLVYLRALLVASIGAARENAVPFLLLAGMLALSLTNTPLRGYYVLDPFVVLHVLVLASVLNSQKLMAIR